MFVPNGYFCRESKFVVILCLKLRFLFRKMRVDSEFLSKKLAAWVSARTILWSIPAAPLGLAYSHRKVILTFVLIHNESDNWILSILSLWHPGSTRAYFLPAILGENATIYYRCMVLSIFIL